MKFEWDQKKERENWAKHKTTFYEACGIYSDKSMLSIFDELHSSDEDRWVTIGQTQAGRVLVVVHTYRKLKAKEVVRIISARKATKNETEQYLKRKV